MASYSPGWGTDVTRQLFGGTRGRVESQQSKSSLDLRRDCEGKTSNGFSFAALSHKPGGSLMARCPSVLLPACMANYLDLEV